MSFLRYLKGHAVLAVCLLLIIPLGVGLLALFGIDPLFLFYVASFQFLIGLAGLILDYLPRRSYYNELLSLTDSKDPTLYLPRLMDDSSLYEAQALSKALDHYASYYQIHLSQATTQSREYREYLELWIHEVKNPLASAYMTLANEPNPKLERSLKSIEAYLDQALYYARASSLEKDYFIQPVVLDELVKDLIKKHASTLIDHHVSIERKNLHYDVKADPKWLMFILEQILINAIKYRSEQPTVCFHAEKTSEAVLLHINDNGLGISPQDLPRVFDKGFTGLHGRRFERSTGLGLYLCKLLAEKMGLSISIESDEGSSTTLTLHFPLGCLTQV